MNIGRELRLKANQSYLTAPLAAAAAAAAVSPCSGALVDNFINQLL